MEEINDVVINNALEIIKIAYNCKIEDIKILTKCCIDGIVRIKFQFKDDTEIYDFVMDKEVLENETI